MPEENLASALVDEAGGCVLPPAETSVEKAADWVVEVLDDADAWDKLGRRARDLAEREFDLENCGGDFERILLGAAR
jgi:glycosyltransferase involved in cell wall biosynthesis